MEMGFSFAVNGELLVAGLAYVAALAVFGVAAAGLLVKLGDREGVCDVD